MTETSQNSLYNGFEDWAQKILAGDSRAISRAISTVENRDAQAAELLKRLFPHTGRAAIIGITGAPGSGKSTLVSALAALLRTQDRQVGILAVDPTSPYTGGAILGDRVRMQAQSTDPGIYIRSMATRGALGGLSAATLDAATVLDAAGKDFILIETVGVGQDEVEIARLADVTLLLLVPGLGDEVQTFKAGVMEIADIFVLNKADLAGADRLETEIQNMLSSAPAPPPWLPPIVRTVATEQRGVQDLLQTVFRFLEFSRQRGIQKRQQVEYWRQRLVELLEERLLRRLLQDVLGDGRLEQYAASIASREQDPYSAVDLILQQAGWHEAKQ